MTRRKPKLRIGVITDIHYGLDTGGKLGTKGPQLMRAFEAAVAGKQPDFIVDMGDRVSSRNAESDRYHMETLMQHFNRMAKPVYHIAGNHDIHFLSREDNLHITGKSAESHSINEGNYHFVFWNPHVTKDGMGLRVTQNDLDWLQNDLQQNPLPTIVFSHAPLYQETNPEPHPQGKVSIRFHHAESEKIREILENSGQVRLCMNGHLHRNHHEEINGIHYIAQQSLVQVYKKKNRVPARAWSWLEIDDDEITVRLRGKVRKDYTVLLAA